MQDIPAANATNSEQSALLSTPNWDTSSGNSAAFSSLLAHESTAAQVDAPAPVPAAPQTELVPGEASGQDTTQQAAVEVKDRSGAVRQVKEEILEAEDHLPADAPEDVREMMEAKHDLQEMKDVSVDMESFQAMRPQLQRYGISDEDIAMLERKVGSEKGITWGELVSFVSKNMKTGPQTVDLSSQQQQKLMTFFQKLGFSAPESKQMVADLADGNFEQIGKAVQKQLTALPQDKLATLDKEEIDAFNELMKKFQSQAKADDRALVRVVGKAMENAMDKARRMAQQQVETRQVAEGSAAASKTVAETATKISTDISKAAAFSDESPVADQAKSQAKDAEKLIKTLDNEDQLKVRVNQAEQSMAKSQGKDSGKQAADSFLKQDNNNQTDAKAWNEFIEKLQLDDTARTTTAKADTSKGLAEAVTQAKTTVRNASQPLTRAEAPRVLKQVENAILKNLTGGGKRLTLQLNPEHLGAVNVALTVKNSEVSATIRADNVEAGKMIADQLETIRQSLEEQGLKVNKLEVQTQLPGSDQNGWQHMAGQDKAFQQGMWNKMRQGMNGNGPGENGISAEQLSEMAREAILSENGNGLHVVA